jgi:hypothetical protein
MQIVQNCDCECFLSHLRFGKCYAKELLRFLCFSVDTVQRVWNNRDVTRLSVRCGRGKDRTMKYWHDVGGNRWQKFDGSAVESCAVCGIDTVRGYRNDAREVMCMWHVDLHRNYSEAPYKTGKS